jgi:hypothetical protein
MKTFSFFSFLGSALLLSLTVARVSAQDNSTSEITDTIISNAVSGEELCLVITLKHCTDCVPDDIDLTVLGDLLPEALAEVVEVLQSAPAEPESESPPEKRSISRLFSRQAPSPNNIVDVHSKFGHSN